MTLADLAALIAGIAVISTVPWSYNRPSPVDFLGPWPRWWPWLRFACEVIGIGCLILVPVILARRASFGGLARPAEFLAACCGLPLLSAGIEILLIRQWVWLRHGIVVPGPGLNGMPAAAHHEWREGAHWAWKGGMLAAAALAALVFLIGRRRLPGWLLTALLMVTWLGFYDSGPELMMQGIGLLIERFASPLSGFIAEVIGVAIVGLPRSLLFAVPVLVMLREVRRPDDFRPTWLEWTSLGLAAILFPLTETAYLVRDYSISAPGELWLRNRLLVRESAILVAVSLGLLIVGGLGPAWSRRPGAGYA